MARTVLLTLGRLPVALTLARALAARGCRVIVADPFRWHVSRPSRAVHRCVRVPPPNSQPEAYRHAMLALIDEESVELIIPVSEEISHVLGLRAYLPAGVTVLGPDLERCLRLQDKIAFAHDAEALGLAVPTTAVAGSQAAQILANTTDTISKPVDGCSGLGLSFHSAGETLPPLAQNMLVQTAIRGQSVSTLSYLHKGDAIATTLYRGRVFSHTVAICFESVPMEPAISEWVHRFIAPLSFTGFLALDFIVDDSGQPWGIECNPRATSGLHFFDEAALGEALLSAAPQQMAAQVSATRQWAYTTLTEAWAALLSGQPQQARTILTQLFSTRDVVWDWQDPLPFLLMTPLSAEILWPAMREGISLGEASQRDIAPLFSNAKGDVPAEFPPGAQPLSRERT